jgi:exonuclease SbcD
MRILHTSDWHLGAALGPVSREAEHAAFLGWLAEVLVSERVDVLVIAGDVFDHAQPSSEAQGLYYRFLAQLSARKLAFDSPYPRKVVVTGGNHDSASRLDAPREVLGALDVAVVGGYEQAREAELLVPVRADGEVIGVIAAVPYVNEYRLGVSARAPSPHEAAASAFASLYGRLADAAVEFFPGVPRVATGHLTCSTRRAVTERRDPDALAISAEDFPLPVHSVGTLGALPPSIFDARWEYVALGHIHRCLAPEAPRIWYSGTPVAMGFTELSPRQVLLVDLDGSESKPRVTALTPPARRRLERLRGAPDAVFARLSEMGLEDTDLPPLVDVVFEVPHYQANLRHQIQRALDGLARPPIVVGLRQESSERGPEESELDERVPVPSARLTPWEIFERAWVRRHQVPPGPDIRSAFDGLASAALSDGQS